MKNDVENLKTIKGKYLAVEIKHNFDDFKLGDTDIEIKMMPRTGTKSYNNFSKHCKIVCSYEGSTLPVGTHFWTRHQVMDTAFDGKYISSELKGESVLATREPNIIFIGEDLKTAKSSGFDGKPWILTQTLQQRKETKGELEIVKGIDNSRAVVINGQGVVEDGAEITWLSGGRIEYWEKEIQYWAVRVDRITSVNGEPFGNFYELDLFEEFEIERNGIVYKGKQAAEMEYGVNTSRKEHLAKLNNPSLEHHDKVAIVKQTKRGVKYSDDVVTLIE